MFLRYLCCGRALEQRREHAVALFFLSLFFLEKKIVYIYVFRYLCCGRALEQRREDAVAHERAVDEEQLAPARLRLMCILLYCCFTAALLLLYCSFS
jgi:hypothetical protein